MIYINPENQKIKDALAVHSKSIYCLINKRIYGIRYECLNKNENKESCVTCKQTKKIKINIYSNIIAFLEINLKHILEDAPKDLMNRQIVFFEQLIQGFIIEHLDIYLKAKNKEEGKRNFIEKDIFIRFNNIFDQISSIFNYDIFTNIKKEYSAYTLSETLNINTCAYCNRLYTKTVTKPNKITRPEFDHWFPKSRFPLLALSFYNLIPCCHVCNSSLKGSTNLNLNDYLHPYIDNEIIINNEVKFSYYNKTLNTYGFEMKTNSMRGKNTVNAFRIKEIYKAHEEEIADLRKIRDIYSDSYLQNLSSLYKGIMSPEEIYRLAFGVYLEEVEFEKRPLSKMKKDILIELGIL